MNSQNFVRSRAWKNSLHQVLISIFHTDCIMCSDYPSVKFLRQYIIRSFLLNIWGLHVQQHSISHENSKSILVTCSLENGHHYLRALSTGAAGTETVSRCVSCDPFMSIKKRSSVNWLENHMARTNNERMSFKSAR